MAVALHPTALSGAHAAIEIVRHPPLRKAAIQSLAPSPHA